ncbi:hypothetical protein E2C01_076527 [Portunus trituberculatus]|uniref:Uncharacterized protein n=1 Tax=Portunus trituberculatus TaxID=210409 RepID=A0A5B7IJ16_PORTR|nr:hypothetical protein [Portunus trituberculatus]
MHRRLYSWSTLCNRHSVGVSVFAAAALTAAPGISSHDLKASVPGVKSQHDADHKKAFIKT